MLNPYKIGFLLKLKSQWLVGKAKLHNCQDLIALFNACFTEQYQTVLLAGGDEPLYSPAQSDTEMSQIVFRHDYFASALHEVAHWCLAGKARLLLQDYGYWYAPCGRDENGQREFEKAEVKPQAIEWAFSLACNFDFKVSADNLNLPYWDVKPFAQQVAQQFEHYLSQGFPPRAHFFLLKLCEFYRQGEWIERSSDLRRVL